MSHSASNAIRRLVSAATMPILLSGWTNDPAGINAVAMVTEKMGRGRRSHRLTRTGSE
jgi:hypothetical protein